jgi:hypothetical protein
MKYINLKYLLIYGVNWIHFDENIASEQYVFVHCWFKITTFYLDNTLKYDVIIY